ncbi:hypothetical protein HDU87_007276 [Geranomyces variabilis]|uniref:Carrier domain-containing protein n=1 Tax=Geranomyces variabilis TaxID=109894 RepID=A0AAD5TGV0_9FUNG|nr:hypothetical protein HDU87_007276 [Geranomyces variabilis]
MSIGFDVAIQEIFCTLSVGATPVISTEDPLAAIKDVDIFSITPTGLQSLDPSDFPVPKDVYLAGASGNASADYRRPSDQQSQHVQRYMPDGMIQILGRIDSQVKFRGYRIELPSSLRSAAVDKQRLQAAPLPAAVKPGITHAAQMSVMEQSLASFWSELLAIDKKRITPSSSFFDLGGNLFLVARLVAGIRNELQIPYSLEKVFRSPTLSQLSRELEFLATDMTSTASCPPQVSATPEPTAVTQPAAASFLYPTPSPEVSKYFAGPYYEWLSGGWKATGSDIKAAVEYLVQAISAHGPIDVLLGLSQGATMVEVLDRVAERGEITKTWEKSVLMNGLPAATVLPSKYSGAVKKPAAAKSLHVHSRADHRYAQMLRLAGHYRGDQRKVLQHAEGHAIPKGGDFVHAFMVGLGSL